MPRRHFGSVRRLPSGRYQASCWHQVERHTAPQTFTTKADAQKWPSNIEATIHRGEWIDLTTRRMAVAELADHWKDRDPIEASKHARSRRSDPPGPRSAGTGDAQRAPVHTHRHPAARQRMGRKSKRPAPWSASTPSSEPCSASRLGPVG